MWLLNPLSPLNHLLLLLILSYHEHGEKNQLELTSYIPHICSIKLRVSDKNKIALKYI